ncbi:MAG: cytochrome c-type biogenesis protein [Betaproteobacteria bacterium]
MRATIVWLGVLIAGFCWGQDPDLEKRVNSLAQELRCLVCQNQTLADSNAPLAVDLRNQVREQLAAGRSEQDVLDFMVARYGDFVLYRPPLKASTLFLWVGPFVFLVAGLWLLIRRVRRQSGPASALSDAERARAAKLLE